MLCGKRGGLPYKDVVRVDNAGDCPNNTMACSKFTNAADTICYPEGELNNCPINVFSGVGAPK